ncbi:hypothetical protein [Paraglaciecola sp. 2405UD69-4]|uniref:hypothetical protein n=1 Tax=Paraglaciecola sp. 2405UD69-4 TaxID=3391836 RepID=UPI0039C9C45D
MNLIAFTASKLKAENLQLTKDDELFTSELYQADLNNEYTLEIDMTGFLKHDAMHLKFPMENRDTDFEWWYFDAALDTGDHVVVMYSMNDTRVYPRQPTVRLNIYTADGREISELVRYTDEQVSVSYDKCDVQLGADICIDQGDHFEIKVMCNQHGFHLKLFKDFEHWVVGKTPQEMEHVAMGWTIAVPQGRVEGTLIKDGVETIVKGSGYRDHNWGTKPMSTGLRNWYWGKLHTPEYAVDYSVMIPREGEPQPMCLVFSKDGVVIDPVFNREGLVLTGSVENIVPASESELGLAYASTLKMKASQGNFEIEFKIELDHLVMAERPLKECAPHGEPAYRYIGNETIKITKAGETHEYKTQALHEIVFTVSAEDQYKGYA